MPLSALIYILLICFCALDTLYRDHRHREAAWFLFLNLTSIMIMLLMFIGYWVRGLVERLGVLAPALLLFSVVWEICTACGGVGRRVDRDMSFRSAWERSAAKGVAIAQEIILAGIGYCFGGLAVLRTL